MIIPQQQVIPLPQGFKRGFAALMSAYKRVLDFVKSCEQFGRPIAELQGIQWMIADMATGLAASQALIYKAALSGGSGYPDKTAAAQAKIFAADNAIALCPWSAWSETRGCLLLAAELRRC